MILLDLSQTDFCDTSASTHSSTCDTNGAAPADRCGSPD